MYVKRIRQSAHARLFEAIDKKYFLIQEHPFYLPGGSV